MKSERIKLTITMDVTIPQALALTIPKLFAPYFQGRGQLVGLYKISIFDLYNISRCNILRGDLL